MNMPFQIGSSTCRWVEDPANDAGLRYVGTAEELAGLRHSGWFLDSFQEDTARGAVYQLPAKDGRERYLAAILDPFNDGPAMVEVDAIAEDEDTAARWADQLAEVYAEAEREYHAKDEAEQQAEHCRETIRAARERHSLLTRDLRQTRHSLTPLLLDEARASLARLRRAARKARERIRELEENYWAAVEPY